jgi:hypothetical protein
MLKAKDMMLYMSYVLSLFVLFKIFKRKLSLDDKFCEAVSTKATRILLKYNSTIVKRLERLNSKMERL